MNQNQIIKSEFFRRDTLLVAQDLLGKLLVRKIGKHRISGVICEVEAYHGLDDLASHASRGQTPRTEPMFGEPGKIYVYLIYGMYFCLNLVTMPENFPAAILIRGIFPHEGLEQMTSNRYSNHKSTAKITKKQLSNLTNGPGKLCQAMQINRSLNSQNLGVKSGLWVEDIGIHIKTKNIIKSKRIGVDYARYCQDWEWNFSIKNIDK